MRAIFVSTGRNSQLDLEPERLVEYRITSCGEALMRFAASELSLLEIDPSSFS